MYENGHALRDTAWNGVVGTGRGNTERAGTRRPSEESRPHENLHALQQQQQQQHQQHENALGLHQETKRKHELFYQPLFDTTRSDFGG
ncbi:hypothetical protein M0804_008238 [Polistes exclamans]|nr:hypothetical protein M0804_008238 [Polistes exclamans]